MDCSMLFCYQKLDIWKNILLQIPKFSDAHYKLYEFSFFTE